MRKLQPKETHNSVLELTCVITQCPNSSSLDSHHLVAHIVKTWLSSVLPSCVCSWDCTTKEDLSDVIWLHHLRINAWGILKYYKKQIIILEFCCFFNFAVCAPGEGDAGQRASPSDESVWRTAHGGVQGRNVQRRRSVRSRRDSTLPGALKLCRTHPSCGGKRTYIIHSLTLTRTQVILNDQTGDIQSSQSQQMMKRPNPTMKWSYKHVLCVCTKHDISDSCVP